MTKPETQTNSAAATPVDTAAAALSRLIAIMARLRDPDGGCPWDIEQTFATIAPYTIEEAYEVDEAIRAGDMASLREELGDLLLQVVFHARMAEEAGLFDFADVARVIGDKMLARHPHVFGDVDIADAEAQTKHWEALKVKERAAKAAASGKAASVLDGVALGLPALVRAIKLQNRAARVGFDWPTIGPVFDKMTEEIAELRTEIEQGASPARLEDEFGDILFVFANLARHLKIEPEQALRGANAKFVRRFTRIEALLAERGRTPEQSTLEEMDALWDQAKAEEKKDR
ncbi:MAG: nucleoside triphosphate pyrophosphohydrolase [Ferrovibrionaceae bacterium]